MSSKAFYASNGWFDNLRDRFGISESAVQHGEAGVINLTLAEEEMQKLCDELDMEGYPSDKIINMDETSLFYRCLPNRNYQIKGSDFRQQNCGTVGHLFLFFTRFGVDVPAE